MRSIRLQSNQERQSERGNVLFLILIAVALFAALSYAVTQSTRSGGGDASRETTLVNSAQITQYPASIKTAITRMIVSNSVSANDLLFNSPSDFGLFTSTYPAADGVFHPTGGGATYSEAPASVMQSGAPGTWHFNGKNEVKDIGLTDGTTSGADIIAFLPGVKQAVCESIHTKLGLSTSIPTIAGINSTADMNPTTPGITAGGGTITDPILDGQPQGCFISGTSYVYYHVLVER